MDYSTWCGLSDDALSRLDIAEVNLAAAAGLPGAEDLSIPALLAQLDGWSTLVRDRTARALPGWPHGPDADLSEGQFRMLALVTVVQRELGVRYYMPFTEGEYDARDSRNLFIHGILSGQGGTCATMPVLYTAIGRRLGYPLRLVMAKEHLFCRWDDPTGERFNIEATTRGFASYADEYYFAWPKPLTERDLGSRPFLRSLSPRQELAEFIAERGLCLRDHLQLAEAEQAFAWGARLSPGDVAFRDDGAVVSAMERLLAAYRRQVAPGLGPAAYSFPAPRDDHDRRCLLEAWRQLKRIFRNRQRTDIEGPPPRRSMANSYAGSLRKDTLCTTPS
jgi:hypothetical protein